MDLLLDNGKENTARDQCKLVHSLLKKYPEDASNLLKTPPRRCQKQPGKRKPAKPAKGAQKASRELFQTASTQVEAAKHVTTSENKQGGRYIKLRWRKSEPKTAEETTTWFKATVPKSISQSITNRVEKQLRFEARTTNSCRKSAQTDATRHPRSPGSWLQEGIAFRTPFLRWRPPKGKRKRVPKAYQNLWQIESKSSYVL